MVETLERALTQLASQRPIFHSEADFQFALAWECKVVAPQMGVRLEVPIILPERTYNLDLLLIEGGKRIGIELKLLRFPILTDINGESFRLKDAAPDLNRYDYLWDLMRLERMLGHGAIHEGYALALSNSPSYWRPRSATKTPTDIAFGLEEGRIIGGKLEWAKHTGGTKKGRETPIHLANAYKLRWQNFSAVPEVRYGAFRTLCVEAKPSLV